MTVVGKVRKMQGLLAWLTPIQFLSLAVFRPTRFPYPSYLMSVQTGQRAVASGCLPAERSDEQLKIEGNA